MMRRVHVTGMSTARVVVTKAYVQVRAPTHILKLMQVYSGYPCEKPPPPPPPARGLCGGVYIFMAHEAL